MLFFQTKLPFFEMILRLPQGMFPKDYESLCVHCLEQCKGEWLSENCIKVPPHLFFKC